MDTDTPMTNGTALVNNTAEEEEEEEEEEDSQSGDEQEILLGGLKKLVVLPNSTAQSASFQIEREDHTLGNALRYFIAKNPDVEFVGYAIPHPSETRMVLRVQIWEECDITVYDALRKGLEDMIEACDVVTDKFTSARDEFEAGKI